VGCAVVGEARWLTASATWHYFNWESKRNYANWVNFLLLICLWLEFFLTCNAHACFSGFDKASTMPDWFDAAFLMIMANSVGKIMQVLSFMVETPPVLLLIKSIAKTLPTLTPHFGLFLAVYYGFAGMAISFFCGKCLQANSDGGPGYWGQSGAVNGTSPASNTPWNETPYGSNPYYYNLNYDGFPNAIMSLYVVMIQNNWNVAANGPIEVTSKYFRWFFVGYTVTVAFVMINVLVGAIIDSLDAVRKEAIRAQRGEDDPLEAAVSHRLSVTTAPSGLTYDTIWELGDMPLEGEVRNDAELCEGLTEIDGKTTTPEQDTQAQEIKYLQQQNENLKRKLEELQTSKFPVTSRMCAKGPFGY